MLIFKEKFLIMVVGDVGGRIVIIVDDIIDDVDSFFVVVEILKERGVYKIFVMVIYGLLFFDVFWWIEEFVIDEVVVINIILYEVQKFQCFKIKIVDISMIFLEVICWIYNGEFMFYFFRNIGLDD